MANYPTTPVPSYVFTEGIEYKTLISEYESGVEQRRNIWSQGRRSFSLIYDVISHNDMDTLFDFYIARNGTYDSFTFTNPRDSNNYTVRFAEDKLSFDEFAYQLSRIGIKLIQVL